nr:uncharacterized protein LOC128690589 [Cherax quadricarinatus]
MCITYTCDLQRLLGGLSKDKEFLVSLLGRRSLRQEVVTVDGGGQVTHTSCQVAAVAKEALSSLQHLESFMWQRDPGGSTGRPGAVDGGAGKTLLQKEREKKERARLKVTLRRRAAILLQQLHQDADVEETLRAAEELVAEVKSVGVGGRLLCRLLVGVGVALPKCNRHEDAIAVLTDAVHIARARCVCVCMCVCVSSPNCNRLIVVAGVKSYLLPSPFTGRY